MSSKELQPIETESGELATHPIRRAHLVAQSPSTRWEIGAQRCSIGSHPSNDVVIGERTVSRFHCEILLEPGGARVRDLGSRNGTRVDGVQVADAFLRGGSELRLGQFSLRFELGTSPLSMPISDRVELGSLIGASPPMRSAFALLERAAASYSTILIEGETGTGKEGAAEAVHLLSQRREKPFIVVDCGAMPASLIESELFGHEKGAFTGAVSRRVGAFEEANGGTLFLDEIGELPLELQPNLLRVLERKEIRRLGANATLPLDVRVIAATHRDLRAMVNDGGFRADLYFRLAVVRIELPPLRKHLQDLPLLVERLLRQLGATAQIAESLRSPEFIASLARSVWPGNVRELRNFLERCIVCQSPLAAEDALDAAADPPPAGAAAEPELRGYAEARRAALDEFERRYLKALLEQHQGNVVAAAGQAGVDRVYLYRLLRRHRRSP